MLAAAPACAADLNGVPEDVSSLGYWPDPVYTDDPYIDVTFTTTTRARLGFEYVVYQDSWNWGDVSCTHMASNSRFSGDPKRHITGGVQKTYRVRMRVLQWNETATEKVQGEWCAGDATITVALEEIGFDYSDETWKSPVRLRDLDFEIRPAYTRPPVERWPR